MINIVNMVNMVNMVNTVRRLSPPPHPLNHRKVKEYPALAPDARWPFPKKDPIGVAVQAQAAPYATPGRS